MSAAPRPRRYPSLITGSKGGCAQFFSGPVGTTSVWPAKASTGPPEPLRAQRLSVSPKRRFSPAKPRGANRDIISSWQPASSGVTDCRRIRSMASSRVGESVVCMQLFVQLDGRLVGFTLHGAGLAVTTEKQVGLVGQIAGLDNFDQLVVVIQQGDLGASGDVQSGFNLAAVAQGDANAGVGADKAVLANGNDDVATTGKSAHGGTAAAQVGALANHDAGRNTAFDHARAFGAGVEVDEAFVHDRGAFTHIGAKTNPCGIGNANAFRYHVVGHLREFVDGFHFQRAPFQTGLELAVGEFVQVDSAFVGPGQVGQQTKYTVQLQPMRFRHAMGNQVKLEVNLGRTGRCVVGFQHCNHYRAFAVG